MQSQQQRWCFLCYLCLSQRIVGNEILMIWQLAQRNAMHVSSDMSPKCVQKYADDIAYWNISITSVLNQGNIAWWWIQYHMKNIGAWIWPISQKHAFYATFGQKNILFSSHRCHRTHLVVFESFLTQIQWYGYPVLINDLNFTKSSADRILSAIQVLNWITVEKVTTLPCKILDMFFVRKDIIQNEFSGR